MQFVAKKIEVLKKGVNKAYGLEKLAQRLNINRNEIAAIGDAANDIEMLQYSGLAIAMGNATEEVKNLCSIVTDTNENNGVIKAIEQVISEKLQYENYRKNDLTRFNDELLKLPESLKKFI